MDERIKDLLTQISEMEDKIENIVSERQEQFLYFYEDGKVKFKDGVEDAHKRLRKTLFRFFLDSKLRNMLSAPFIYSMIFPFLILDLSITLYQVICFSLYRIKKVKRSQYIIIDRHKLQHLNSIERFNCLFCEYGNGVIAYAREVAARTEQYWCPIKHARKVIGRHSRYNDFLDYGDAVNYHEQLMEFRKRLAVQ